MSIKIKDNYVAKAHSERIKAYLLNKALRKEEYSDEEIKKTYKMSDVDFDAAVDILLNDGIVEKK